MDVLNEIRPMMEEKLALMDFPMNREACRQCSRKISAAHVGARDRFGRPVCLRCEIKMVRANLRKHRKGANVAAARLKRLEERL